MKVMIDTNIIISAVLFPGGKASSAMFKALLPPFKPLISDLILSELHQKFQEKFPADQPKLDAFFEYALPVIQIIDTPRAPAKSERGLEACPLVFFSFSPCVILKQGLEQDFCFPGLVS